MAFSLSPFVQIADRVYRAVAEPDSVTIGLVVGDDGAMVIDTGSSPEQGRTIRKAAEQLAGRPITHVAITHGHRDHCLGLRAFSDCITAGHKSSENWPADPELRADAKKLGVHPDDILVPNETFAMVKAYDLGNQRVELVHGGAGHSHSDIVVIIPQADVVFVGDLWEESATPSYGTDTDVSGWAMTLDTVMGAFGDNTIVVVGHGKPVDRMWALSQRMNIGAIHSIVKWLVAKRVPIEDAYASAPEWPWDKPTIESLLPIAYDQISSTIGSTSRNLPLRPIDLG